MSIFEERLARLADRARPLDADLARELIQFAGDVAVYLDQQRDDRYDGALDVLEKYNNFMSESLASQRRYHDEHLGSERRRLARMVAGDARWQGGYADALALLEREDHAAR